MQTKHSDRLTYRLPEQQPSIRHEKRVDRGDSRSGSIELLTEKALMAIDGHISDRTAQVSYDEARLQASNSIESQELGRGIDFEPDSLRIIGAGLSDLRSKALNSAQAEARKG